MIAFLIRRLIQAFFVVVGVTLVTFILFYLVGGDPALIYGGKNASPETLNQLRKELGLDQPLFFQYLDFLQQSLTWNWGASWSTKQNVNQMIASSIGASLSLSVPAYALSVLMALALSLLAAAQKNSWLDRGVCWICFTLMSLSFLVYIIYGQKILAFDLSLFPVYGWDPSWMGRWTYISLPCLIYAVASLPPKLLLFRSAILNEVDKDYVRTAFAKGLSPLKVYTSHILKNAALPILALITSQMPSLITGSLLLEAYFGIPGIGGLLLKAIQGSDLPLIKSLTVMGSMIYILFNLINDLIAALIDTRWELK